jgi:hypothetical protein
VSDCRADAAAGRSWAADWLASAAVDPATAMTTATGNSASLIGTLVRLCGIVPSSNGLSIGGVDRERSS